ncbi:MAG: hypothetical protein A2X56_09980 [Nitrospirae bacterium GWC2_57_13]|nr:MAG: hypothetical protein A2X56_09980 [Nitrospirae bacterium GWC2_57_13]
MTLKLRASKDNHDVVVKNWSEASLAFREWVSRNCYGASDLTRGAGDIVAMGKKVAHVSYNGRVWVGEEVVFEVQL